MSEITSATINTLPVGIHRLESGVYLRVTKTSRYWFFKYTIRGLRREMGLGAAKGQTLGQVRLKATKAKALLAEGIDPLEVGRQARTESRARAEAERRERVRPRVHDVLDDALEHIFFLRQFMGKLTETSWIGTFKKIDRAFGDKFVDTVSADDIVAYLQPSWTTQPRTSRDNLGRVTAFFDYCVSKNLRPDNPARWAGNLDARLPSLRAVRRVVPEKHHAALPAEELRRIAQVLWAAGTMRSLRALFGMLTVGRLAEYGNAQWSEVDLTRATLSVPMDRRKDKNPEPFVVPLSRQAMAVLERLDTASPWLFPGRTGKKPADLADQIFLLRSLTKLPVTNHGARSTFSDWCAKNEKNFLVSEKCLMHKVGNQVFRAYQRDDQLEQRRKLLQEWADYLLPDAG